MVVDRRKEFIMATFELDRDYATTILDESEGSWIVDRLIRQLSRSEAAILLRPSERECIEVEFASSEVCLVRFSASPSNAGPIYERLSNITTLWLFLVSCGVATPIRLIRGGISFLRDRDHRFTLTIPLEPSLSTDEWHRLGTDYLAVVTVNDGDGRRIRSEKDIEDLCQELRALPSFWLHASRFEGDELDLSVDDNGASVFYLDIKRGTKMISEKSGSAQKDTVKIKIDALPHMDVEIERRHLIPFERGLAILRAFLNRRELGDMVHWPVED